MTTERAAYVKAWIAKDPARWKAIHDRANAVYREKHHDVVRTSQDNYYRRIRLETIAFFGGVCVRCAFADPRALQIDHVAGDGYREPKLGRQNRLYALIKQDPSTARLRYQLLCANCNAVKRIENREFGPGRSGSPALLED